MKQRVRGLRVRPTGFGALLAAVCVAAGMVAPKAADPQVAGLARTVLGAVVLIGAVWPVCSLALVRVSVIGGAVDATVDEDFDLDLRLSGWSSSLELRLAGGVDEAWHRAGAPGVGRMTCPALAHGRYEHLVLELSSSAPLGVVRARRRVRVELAAPLYVAPAVIAVWWRPELVDSGSTDGSAPKASLTGDAVRSVRPYVPGDPSHLVHWPSSARAGALMIRELEPPAEIGAAVVVELGDDPERAESVASHAAGVVIAVIDAGGRLTLCTRDEDGPRTDTVSSELQAMRLLASAVPGQPGSAPSGWPIVAVHP